MGRDTWVSGGTSTVRPYEDTGPGVVIDVGAAWQNVAPAEAAHTSGRDRAIGLLIKSIPVLALELILSIALTVLGVLVLGVDASAGPVFLVILLLWGGMGLGSYLFLAERSDWYSSVGVEHHRVDSAEAVALRQIDSDKSVRLAALSAYVQAMTAIETAKDSEQKQLRGPK